MTLEIETIQDTNIVKIYAPYDEALKELRNQGYREVSLEENALLRMLLRENLDIRDGNWVREDVIYIPNKGAFLTKNPATSESPAKATKANRNGKEFYPPEDLVELVLEDSVQIPYSTTSIPANRFNDEEITKFVFGNQAGDYGDLLGSVGLYEMLIKLENQGYVNNKSEPFARKVWFNPVYNHDSDFARYRSELSADCNWYLHYTHWVFGTKEDAAKTQISEEPKKKKIVYINPFEIDLGDEE